MKLSFRSASAIVAVSEYCAKPMRRDLLRPVTVIHNWVDTDRFTPEKDIASGAKIDAPFKLLFVGNPARRKGSDVLGDLAAKLGEDFEISCLGGLRRSFESRRSAANMKILTSVSPEEMPTIYRETDAVLVPTRYEPFGYVALEAMACGLPVLGFNSSGTAEVCENGVTALLAPVDDVERLATFARQLASDQDLRERLGAAGRLRAIRYFNASNALAAYMRIYEQALTVSVR